MDILTQTLVQDDVAAVQALDVVPTILENVCRLTGMGFAAVARVTPDRWIACSVRDGIAFGLEPGDELPIDTTICDAVRSSGVGVLFPQASADPVWAEHPVPRLYGFESNISLPIRHADGRIFGTLCAIDPKPRDIERPEIRETLELFATLIAHHLDSAEQVTSSRKLLADARRTAELREEFIAVLGHDLRNPLAAVGSGIGMLERNEELSERGQEIARMMRQSIKRAGGLIDDVLDFARGRLDGGIAIQRQGDVQLDGILLEVVNEARSFAPDIDFQVEFTLDAPVNCDGDRIAQMVSNLVGNAASHGDPHKPVLVSARREGPLCVIDVENGGVPIPAQARERLFEPFFRDEASTPREGLGLGLYIADQIARAHDGLIEVDTNEERTVFSVRFRAD